ncbi:MAG: phosphodiester glycosidase family protein [Cyanobacteria bacterium J06623_4]
MRRRSFSTVAVAVLGGLGLGMAGCEPMPAMTAPTATELAEDSLPLQRSVYQRYDVLWGTAHVVVVPPGGEVAIAASTDLQPLSAFITESGSAFAINAGFFDPQNGKTTSHLMVDGEVVGDPADNERLVGNPDLAPYLDQILNRSEFRIYRCANGQAKYGIALRDAPVPADCEIESAVGAGPQLLPEDTSQLEAFTDYADGELIRDAIGSAQPNARSAVGLDAQGAVYLIMAEKNAESTGARLSDMTDFAADLGVTQLLNLDGGSSSGLYAQPNQFYFGRTDAEGNPIERPIKSAIVVGDGSAENE